jgi:uncharacterized SAM-binding protein YcdF (DUF218 family)
MEAILQFLVLPSGLLVLCLAGALVLFPWRRMRPVAAGLAALAAIIYLVFGSGPVAHTLLGGLEYRYQAPENMPELDHIVVLAAYGAHDPRVSVINQVNSHALIRLVEASLLAREHPEAILTVTGGGQAPKLMADVLIVLGVPENRIRVEALSSNTYESAVHLQAELKERRFALVTSAGHMSRAMMVFRGQGLDPIPAPTDYLSFADIWTAQILAKPGNLLLSDLAIHEYIALVWYRWRGLDGRAEDQGSH